VLPNSWFYFSNKIFNFYNYFFFTALYKDGITIIFVPALALINDLLAFFRLRKVPAASINSLNHGEWNDVKKRLVNGSYKFFLWTPEMGGINTDLIERIDYLIDNFKIDYFVVEEAHYIDAINEVTGPCEKLRVNRQAFFQTMSRFRQRSPEIPWIALTTASEAYKEELCTNLSMADARFIRPKSPYTMRKNIFYKVLEKNTSSVEIAKKLLEENEGTSGIIFCNSVNMIGNILKKLRENGVSAIEYYGGIPQENIEKWAAKEFQVIVAKGESFGFGLNHFIPPSIRFVIHRYVPGNFHAYYHVSII
jgi:ATP-dependent DNA helicase RecQ